MFATIRRSVGIDEDVYMRAVAPTTLPYLEFISNSKSGQDFFLRSVRLALKLLCHAMSKSEKIQVYMFLFKSFCKSQLRTSCLGFQTKRGMPIQITHRSLFGYASFVKDMAIMSPVEVIRKQASALRHFIKGS